MGAIVLRFSQNRPPGAKNQNKNHVFIRNENDSAGSITRYPKIVFGDRWTPRISFKTRRRKTVGIPWCVLCVSGDGLRKFAVYPMRKRCLKKKKKYLKKCITFFTRNAVSGVDGPTDFVERTVAMFSELLFPGERIWRKVYSSRVNDSDLRLNREPTTTRYDVGIGVFRTRLSQILVVFSSRLLDILPVFVKRTRLRPETGNSICERRAADHQLLSLRTPTARLPSDLFR